MTAQIGLIGAGNMGAAFGRRLLAAGRSLHLCDVRPEACEPLAALGATIHATPRAVADAADMVLISLPTPAVVDQVTQGQDGIGAGQRIKYLIDLSTSGPDTAQQIALRLAGQGVEYIDAPVSGGVAGATAGTVVIMLACQPQTVRLVSEVLKILGRIFYVGPSAGQGQITKVLNNLLSAGSLLLAAEAAAMGAKAGVDPDMMIAVFNAGSGRSSATLDKYPKAILPGTFNLGFTNALMLKDIDLCLQLAARMQLAMPLGLNVRREWHEAMALVGADADFSTIVRKSELNAGVEVRSRAPRTSEQ